MLDGYLNFHYLQQDPTNAHTRLILESGINAAADIQGLDGGRRPAIAIRSSPWKAGSAETPWHDEFDLDHGHIRYFGDHKVTTAGHLGSTRGNRALIEAHQLHQSTSYFERSTAPPLLAFAATPVIVGGVTRWKGFLSFMGVALIERLEHVVQRDPQSGESFPNIVVDLNIIQLGAEDSLDFRWIDDRRNVSLTAEDSLRFAPDAWRRWVREGKAALPRVRRRVLSSRVLSKKDQLPPASSKREELLETIYRFYDNRKHAFEELAARVASVVLGDDAGNYSVGWLTRSGGDGGLDFVGRLDVGPGDGAARLVVLGQAKCVKPDTGISPDQVARLVARLRRGWIGVYVTTGHFSRQAQVEIVDDEYPVVLVAGGRLADVVFRIAEESYQGDVNALLTATVESYPAAITSRRPHEIVTA